MPTVIAGAGVHPSHGCEATSVDLRRQRFAFFT